MNLASTYQAHQWLLFDISFAAFDLGGFEWQPMLWILLAFWAAKGRGSQILHWQAAVQDELGQS